MTTPAVPAGGYNAAVALVDHHVGDGRGDKPAFVDPRRTLTYRDLATQIDRFAVALRTLAVAPEQRLVLILLDTVEFPICFLGAIKAGVVAVPVNTLLAPDQWQFILEDSRATAVVVSAELWERAAPVLRELQARRGLTVITTSMVAPDTLSLDRLLDPEAPPLLAPTTHADEVAFWLYTSGSTGRPKGARHVHSSLAATAELYGKGVIGYGEQDVVYSAAKLFFAYGLGNGLSFPLAVGATTILWPDRPTPEAVLAIMRTYQPSIFCAVPTLYAALVAGPELGAGAGSARLRRSVSAGEALPEDVGRRWAERVGVEVLDGIGSTEMLHIFVSNRPGEVRYGSTGKPVPGYQARIIDEHGHPLGPGEIGELVVKGPSAAEGYWNQRERSRRTFVGEWTHTGDKYRVDEQGFFYYCGRTDDMFKVSGIWVSPFEVESALVGHPAVLEAAVVGREDADGLTKPHAFVVLRPGVVAEGSLFAELKERAKAGVGVWAYPRWIDVVPALPKTATGKIQRFKLRDDPGFLDGPRSPG